MANYSPLYLRLKQAIEWLKANKEMKQQDIAKAMGMAESSFSRSLKRCESRVDKDFVIKFYQSTDEIFSLDWLLFGTGNKFQRVPNNEPAFVGDGPVLTMEATKGKPYYNVDFRLGFDIMTNEQTQNPDYMIDFPPYNDVDCWVNAHGDSMAPTISSGDIVALKRIEDHSYLINGEIYAIVTSNGLRTIKRIRDNGETFTLIADNREVGEQVIPKQLVTHVYHVRGTIKMF